MSGPIERPPVSNNSLIEVRDLYKSFDGKPVIQGISFDVHEQEVVAVIGTSGCGKSTLLKLIAGLIQPDRGTVNLKDPNFTLVFQYSALFDSLTVYENVAFSLLEDPDYGPRRKRKERCSEKQMRDMVAEKLKLVGLEGIEEKYPNELSGGMQKRVSFARAIMSEPRIILYDEPTSGLDPVASNVIEDYILKLRDQLDAASVVVTHTFSTICRTADRVLLLDKGRVHWEGTPMALIHSDDPICREFVRAGLDLPGVTVG
jgi:phospholipid/cholesterol/gamma-HCH transport system ATP-binding protein